MPLPSLTPLAWTGRRQTAGDQGRSPGPVQGSVDHASDRQSDEAATARCFTKTTLAQYLGLSVRSLDRAIAIGLLPAPDLILGRSARWTPETTTRWMQSRPRLPGRSPK
jgi:hypothetical protein